MEIEKLFVSLFLDSADYTSGLSEAQAEGASFSTHVRQTIGGGLQAAAAIGMAALAVLATAVIGIGIAAFGVSSEVANAAARMQSELNVTAGEAERLANVAADVWGNNFAGSIEEAAAAVTVVRQQLGDLSDDEMQRVTENAFRISDAFDADVGDSVSAAKTLMENFGLTSDQAFDFIAGGFQRGLDRSGDFLDSIGEYSTQFANGGADAGQFFSLLESGLAGGALGTDKAADAFKEFRVRIQDGSTATADALEAIGINADVLLSNLANGTIDSADAFDVVLKALNDVDDQSVLMQAGVGLLGTQFEDLGTDAALALQLWGTGLDDLAGSTDAIDARYKTLPDAVEGFKRRALLALQPIGDVLLDLSNRILPLIETGFAFFETSVVPAIETAAAVVGSFFANLEEGMAPLDAFIEAIWDIAPPEVLDALVNFRDDILPGLMAAIMAVVTPIVDFVAENVELKDILIAVGLLILSILIPAILSIVAAVAPVIVAFGLVVAAVALLRTAWEENWGGIQEKTQAVVTFIQSFISSTFAAIQAFWSANGDAILAKAREIWTAIQTAIQTAITTVQTIVTTIATAIQTFWAANGDTILAKAQEIWAAIQTAISTAITTIQTIVTTIATAIQAFWEAHGATILTAAENYWTLITTFISDAFTLLQTIWSLFKAAFEGDWEAFGATLVQLWEDAWTLVVNYLSNLWSLVSPLLQGFWTSIQSWFTGIDWPSLGKSIIDGIVNGIVNAGASILDALSDIIQGAIAQILLNLGISSPSRVMADLVGAPMAQGLIVGWEETLEQNSLNASLQMAVAGLNNGDSYSSQTTVQLAPGADPLRALRASRHLDKLGVA